MSAKAKYIFTYTLSLMLLVSGCASPPTAPQAIMMTLSTLPAETATATQNGLAVRETKRVGTVFAIQTASTTLLPSPTPTNTPTAKPTLTPKPFSKSDVLVSFTRYGPDGMDEISSCLSAYNTYRFVLYRDGRLIQFDGSQYLETRISQEEIDELLSEIDATGIAEVVKEGDQYTVNAPITAFQGGYSSSIVVNGKNINFDDAKANYLIEPVTKTLEIIENYPSKNLQPYSPEILAVWVFLEKNISLGLANPTPVPRVLKWLKAYVDLDSLLVNPISFEPKIISGDILSLVMDEIKTVPAFRKVEQTGQNYLLLVCPSFP